MGAKIDYYSIFALEILTKNKKSWLLKLIPNYAQLVVHVKMNVRLRLSFPVMFIRLKKTLVLIAVPAKALAQLMLFPAKLCYSE